MKKIICTKKKLRHIYTQTDFIYYRRYTTFMFGDFALAKYEQHS